MRIAPLAALPLITVALSACAPSTMTASPDRSSPPRQCVFTDRIDNFRQADDGRTLYLKSRRNEVFEVRSAGYCPDLDTTIALAIQPDAGMSQVCAGDWARILVSGGSGPAQVCRVQVVKRLTTEEIAALPPRSRP